MHEIISQKVRKFKKIAIFQNQTFELGESIIKQIKNRPETNGCTFWAVAAGCLDTQ